MNALKDNTITKDTKIADILNDQFNSLFVNELINEALSSTKISSRNQ